MVLSLSHSCKPVSYCYSSQDFKQDVSGLVYLLIGTQDTLLSILAKFWIKTRDSRHITASLVLEIRIFIMKH
jgi:hypothetical protein